MTDQIDNFILTASRGGRDDHLINEHNLRESVVVFSEDEAYERGLEIDHNDSHAAVPDWEYDDFALLIHGTQPERRLRIDIYTGCLSSFYPVYVC